MRVQSSIKDTNHLVPEQFGNREASPQKTSIQKKYIDENFYLLENKRVDVLKFHRLRNEKY